MISIFAHDGFKDVVLSWSYRYKYYAITYFVVEIIHRSKDGEGVVGQPFTHNTESKSKDSHTFENIAIRNNIMRK